MCDCNKPLSDFNPSTPYLCRQCSAQRSKQWAKNNPKRRKELDEKYRKTPHGRAAFYRRHKAWRAKNQWCDRERARRESTQLTDFYIKTILKKRGVKNPTPEHITS